MYVSHNTTTDLWEISFDSVDYGLGDAGGTFSITSAGQVRITTDDLTGANYAGFIRFTSITLAQ